MSLNLGLFSLQFRGGAKSFFYVLCVPFPTSVLSVTCSPNPAHTGLPVQDLSLRWEALHCSSPPCPAACKVTRHKQGKQRALLMYRHSHRWLQSPWGLTYAPNRTIALLPLPLLPAGRAAALCCLQHAILGKFIAANTLGEQLNSSGCLIHLL